MDDLGVPLCLNLITSRAAALANPDLPIVARIELAMGLRETLLEYVQDQTKTLLSTLLTNEAQE